MNKAFIAVLPLFFVASVQAQPSLADQINAVRAVELQQQAADRAAAQAREAALRKQADLDAAARRRAQQARDAETKRQNDAHAEYLAQQKAQADAKAAEALADKKRDQAYQDQQRQLALEEQKLKLQMLKAKADRANDYIDQDLGRQAAQTDVIQSRADATRNVSEGTKSLLQSTGEAEVKDASRWFK